MTPFLDPVTATLTINTVCFNGKTLLNLPPDEGVHPHSFKAYLIKPRRKSWLFGYFYGRDRWWSLYQYNPMVIGKGTPTRCTIRPGDQWALLPEGMMP